MSGAAPQGDVAAPAGEEARLGASLSPHLGPHLGPRLSVVVPTLDEAANIDALLGGLADALAGADFEILIVDDGSSDGTAAAAKAWAERVPVRVLERRATPDLARSIIEGAQQARGEVVLVMDADGSHPTASVVAVARPVLDGEQDLVIGSRYVRGGSTPGWPWYRRLISRSAAALAWPLSDVHDPTAGFFAVRTELLRSLPTEVAGYKILLELLVGHPRVQRVAEVPISFRDRTRGESKLGLRQHGQYLGRLVALGGGRMSSGRAGRFALVGVAGMVLDLIVYSLMVAAGASLDAAHLSGFATATALNFALNYRWTFAGAAGMPLLERYGRFMWIAVLAALLRGGVLATGVQVLGLPERVAIVPAIGAAALINFLGYGFYVFAAPTGTASAVLRWRLALVGVAGYLLLLRLAYLPVLAPADAPAGGQAGAVLLTAGGGLLLAGYAYRLTRLLWGKRAGLAALALSLMLPLPYIAGLWLQPALLLGCACLGALYHHAAWHRHGVHRHVPVMLAWLAAGLWAHPALVLVLPALLAAELEYRRPGVLAPAKRAGVLVAAVVVLALAVALLRQLGAGPVSAEAAGWLLTRAAQAQVPLILLVLAVLLRGRAGAAAGTAAQAPGVSVPAAGVALATAAVLIVWPGLPAAWWLPLTLTLVPAAASSIARVHGGAAADRALHLAWRVLLLAAPMAAALVLHQRVLGLPLLGDGG